MDKIKDKIDKLEELIKGLKANIQSAPVLPSIKQSKLQGIKPPPVTNKMPSAPAPKGQKNPVKQAEQVQNKDIKDMKMREAREALKINKSTGQWSLEKKEEGSAPDMYHIHKDGMRITDKPLSLKDIHQVHGGVKKLEGSGHILHPVKVKKS